MMLDVYFQVIIPGTSTTGTVTRLTPFTTYNCSVIIYASSITRGIMSQPITVDTDEAGIIGVHA